MLDFYTNLLGFKVTDRGKLGPEDGPSIIFLSQQADEHHQIVVITTRRGRTVKFGQSLRVSCCRLRRRRAPEQNTRSPDSVFNRAFQPNRELSKSAGGAGCFWRPGCARECLP